MAGRAREALLAGAADAHEHGVAARLAQDALDARHVLDGVAEEDELHLRRVAQVVVLERVVEHGHDLVEVRRLLVGSRAVVGARAQEVDEEHGLGLEEVRVRPAGARAAEEARDELLDHGREDELVVRVDEAVVEHAEALVRPELGQRVERLALLRHDHEHALEDLAHVAQVEGVVRLDGRRLHGLARAVEHLDGRGHDLLGRALDVLGEDGGEAREDGAEDALQHLLGGRRDAEHVEVAREARRHDGAAAARRRGRAHDDRVRHVLPEELLPVVEALVIRVLAQQLDGRLRAVGLDEGHVHVVHVDDDALARRRAELRLLLLLELALDGHLRVERGRLRAEVDEDGHDGHAALVVGRGGAVQEVLHDDRLARARHAREEDRVELRELRLQQVAEAHRVDGRHDHVEVGHLAVVGEGRQDGAPLEPGHALGLLALRDVREGVVDRARAVADLGQHGVLERARADVEVELLEALRGDAAADGPDEGEGEERVEHLLDLLGVALDVEAHGRARLLVLVAGHADERREEAAQALHRLDLGRDDGLDAVRLAELQAEVDGREEEVEHVVLERLAHLGGHLARDPRAHEGLPAQRVGREEDDAEARDGGRARLVEVADLEEHAHLRLELDALAVREAERHVVVQHRVHVLDPDGVDGPVEDGPLAVLRLVRAELAHDGRAEAVRPLAGHLAELAVELAHRDALGVQHLEVHELHDLVLGAGLAQRLHGGGQRAVGRRLAAHGQAREHGAEAHLEDLEELQDLGVEGVDVLQALQLELVQEHLHELTRLVHGHGHAREEVAHDGVEERQVVREELGDVAVLHGADQHDVLAEVREGAL